MALAGECDGAAMCAVAAGLADLPFQVGQQHATVGASLSDATRGVQARTQEPRWGCFAWCLCSMCVCCSMLCLHRLELALLGAAVLECFL